MAFQNENSPGRKNVVEFPLEFTKVNPVLVSKDCPDLSIADYYVFSESNTVCEDTPHIKRIEHILCLFRNRGEIELANAQIDYTPLCVWPDDNKNDVYTSEITFDLPKQERHVSIMEMHRAYLIRRVLSKDPRSKMHDCAEIKLEELRGVIEDPYVVERTPVAVISLLRLALGLGLK